MNYRHTVILLVATLAAGTIPAIQGMAQDANTNIEQRLEELEQEIRILRRQQELQQEQTDQKAKETPIVKAGADGFSLQSADGKFVLYLRGQLQFDSRWYVDDQANNGTDTFLIRRARPILEGTLFNEFDFKLMPDFGQGQVVLFDAYVEWRHWDWLKLRAGKFKSPIGEEQLEEDIWTLFTERSLATDLVPNRDVGVDLNGNLFGGVIAYAAGVFNGVPDGANGDLDNNDAKDYEGRLFIQPFKTTDIEPLRGLGFGVAGSLGDEGGSPGTPNLPTYKTTGQNTFFKYLAGTTATVTNTVIANGEHTRWTPQGYYYWGPLGLLAEYAVSDQKVQIRPGGVKTSDYIRNSAWQVTGSWVLTGERATFAGVTPKQPFNLSKGTWGAFQLVARYSDLHIDPNAFPAFSNPAVSAQEAYDWGVGLNWYLNRNVMFKLDYDQTSFDGGAGTTANVKNREIERFLSTRAQLWF